MKNVSAEFKKSIRQSSRAVSSKLIFNDFTILDADVISINLNDAILSNEKFELGGAIAAAIDIEISNFSGAYTEALFKDKEFILIFGLELEDESIEDVDMGTYKVFEPTISGKTIKLECYDKFIDMDKSYDTALQYPMPVHSILTDISQAFNISLSEKLKNGDYTNSDFIIQGKPTDITYRQVLHDIAIIIGGFAVIRNNTIDIIYIAETDLEINTGNSFKSPTISRTYEKITQVDINGTIKGTLDGNKLELDVPLLDYNSTSDAGIIAESILNKYKDFIYTGFSANWQGDFSVETGDSVKITDINNRTYQSFISGNKLIYSGGLKAETESKIDKEFIKTASRDIQKLQSQIKEVESGMYYFTNESLMTIQTIFSQFAFIGFATSGSTNLLLHVAIMIEGTGTVECQLLLDSKQLIFAPKINFTTYGLLSFSIPLIQLTGDSHSIVVMLKASASMQVKTEQGQITIFGHNLSGALSDELPHAELHDTLVFTEFKDESDDNVTIIIPNDIKINLSDNLDYSDILINNTIVDAVSITLG